VLDHLEGTLVRDDPTRLVVAVGGLGYQCQVPLGTAQRLRRQGERVRVFTLTVVQEELPKLLGFASEEERDLCRLLLKVSGVGPALALALLSADSPRRLLEALQEADVAWLRRIKGVGAKTAERLCLELRDQAKEWLPRLSGGGVLPRPPRDAVAADAALALTSLGFTPIEAESRVAVARERQPQADAEALIKAALRG
jgi:Holliday junction DNA helicase RuvA